MRKARLYVNEADSVLEPASNPKPTQQTIFDVVESLYTSSKLGSHSVLRPAKHTYYEDDVFVRKIFGDQNLLTKPSMLNLCKWISLCKKQCKNLNALVSILDGSDYDRDVHEAKYGPILVLIDAIGIIKDELPSAWEILKSYNFSDLSVGALASALSNSGDKQSTATMMRFGVKAAAFFNSAKPFFSQASNLLGASFGAGRCRLLASSVTAYQVILSQLSCAALFGGPLFAEEVALYMREKAESRASIKMGKFNFSPLDADEFLRLAAQVVTNLTGVNDLYDLVKSLLSSFEGDNDFA